MLPPALVSFADRLAGVSTNHIRLEPQGARSGVKANQTIGFTLPANTLLKPDSFALHFNASAIATGSAAARLPPDAGSLFDRVEVSVGGVQLSAGSNYGHVLRAAKRGLMTGPSVDRGTDLCMAHGEMVRKQSYMSDAAIGLAETADVTVRDFGGLLSESVILDTSLMGDLTVTLHTASDNVISVCNADPTTATLFQVVSSQKASYTLNDIYASIEVMAISDGSYATLAKRIIGEKGFLEVPFKNVHSSVQTHVGASRFNVSTQSLDRVWVTFRNMSTLAANLPAVPALGYIDNSPYELSVTKGEKWLPNSLVLSNPDSNAGFQLTLNGSMYPQYPAKGNDWLAVNENSLPPGHMLCRDLGAGAYEAQRFVLCARLNAPGSESVRSISGLDTRGVSLAGQVVTHNDQSGGSHQVLIFCECTSSLRVGPGRVVEVVM
jgi:hypothetical protein